MAKIPIYTEAEKWMLRIEYEAYEENQQRDIQLSIRNRTMTKEIHYKITHSLRLFWWHLKQNKFVAGDYVF